jgi:hypothetical protein
MVMNDYIHPWGIDCELCTILSNFNLSIFLGFTFQCSGYDIESCRARHRETRIIQLDTRFELSLEGVM